MTTSNRTIIDLGKVQHATLVYRNQYGHNRHSIPEHTFLNQTILAPPKHLWYKLDRWHPVLSLQLTASHTIEYTNEKALSLWKAWRAKIFGNK